MRTPSDNDTRWLVDAAEELGRRHPTTLKKAEALLRQFARCEVGDIVVVPGIFKGPATVAEITWSLTAAHGFKIRIRCQGKPRKSDTFTVMKGVRLQMIRSIRKHGCCEGNCGFGYCAICGNPEIPQD